MFFINNSRYGLLKTIKIISALLVFILSLPTNADTANIAIASNFNSTAKKLAVAFHEDSEHTISLSFASSGKLFTQIKNGAPYAAFLSADIIHSEKLINLNLAEAESLIVYARGKLALFQLHPFANDNLKEILLKHSQKEKLALANPKTAPYGQAGIETLESLELYQPLAGSIVRAENVGQAFQYVYSGNASLGFVALSQVLSLKAPSYIEIPTYLYRPIKQSAVIIKHGSRNQAAKAFLTFLKTQKAKQIIKASGYGI